MKRLTVKGRQTVLGLLGILVLVLLMRPSAVLAHTLHAVLLRSDPPDGSILTTAPTVVHLWFSEPVQIVGQSIIVIDPAGKHAERGSVHLNGVELSVDVAASRTGTYLVIWQVISQDTDPAQGSLTFSVGQESATPVGGVGGVSSAGLALQILARWLHFAGYALAFGVLAFLVLVLRSLALNQERVEQRLWRLIHLGLLALLLAEPVALFAQMVSLQSFDVNLVGDILASTFGRVLAQRLGAAILLWVLIGLIQQGSRLASSAALALGVALACVDSMASHALTSRASWLGPQIGTLDIAFLGLWTIHVAAMGLWVGGLAALLSVWQLTALSGKRSAMVARFGQFATLSLTWLIVSGMIMSILHLARPTDLLTTNYGRVLAVKTVLVLVTMLLALLGLRAHQHHRARWWTLEALILTGILLLAGVLVSLPPPI